MNKLTTTSRLKKKTVVTKEQRKIADSTDTTAEATSSANGVSAGMPLFLQSMTSQASSEVESAPESQASFAETSSEVESVSAQPTSESKSSPVKPAPESQPTSTENSEQSAAMAKDTETNSETNNTVASAQTTKTEALVAADEVLLSSLESGTIEKLSPLNLTAAPSLIVPRVQAEFDTTTTLDVTALRRRMLPPQPENSSPENSSQAIDAALALAAQQYASAAEVVRQQQEKIRELGNQSISNLVANYTLTTDKLPSIYLRADEAITKVFEQSQSQIENTAVNADNAIVQEHDDTTKLLNRTAASARGAIANNAKTAQSQISTIVDNLAARFVNVLTAAAQECETTSFDAHTKLEQWQSNLATTFDVNAGTGLKQAENEAKIKAARPLVEKSLSQVAEQAPATIGMFNSDIKQVRSDVQEQIKPTLQPHADNISTRGNASVNQAFEEATKSLNEQTLSARKTISQTRDNAIAQLTTQRRAARTRLEGNAKRTQTDLHRETYSATHTLVGSVRNSLPHYSSALSRMRTSLSQTASSGTEAIKKIAPQLAQQAKQAAVKSYDTQQPPLQKIQDNTKNNLTKRLQQAQQQTEQEVTSTTEQMQTSAEQSIPKIMESADSLTSGFNKLGKGIQQAAQKWATPLQQTFASTIKELKAKLNKQFPQQDYETQIEKKKEPFITLMKKLQNPTAHFHEPLKKAWNTVRLKLDDRFKKLNAALDAGFIDDVNEAGVTAALRGVTLAQGNALRELYTKHGSLDIKLQESLGDSKDYYAAINYLSGNTAVGAEFELQASIHLYNDEESRIKDVMRSLSREQLEQLHQLPGAQETLKEVQGNLDGTDLNVFDALNDASNANRHAKADAYEMRDRIDEVRRKDDKDALNTVLAEYSRAADPEQYGGEDVSATERRRRVQQEFAKIQGIDLTAQATSSKISKEDAAAQALLEYATRDIKIDHRTGEGGTYTETLRVEGANRDLAEALIFHGEQSAQARAARLGVEVQRPGGAKILNLDTALVDPRLSPNLEAPDEETRQKIRAEALQERELMLFEFAKKYGGANATISAEEARNDLITKLREASSSNSAQANLAEALVRDDYPTPATAAIAMEYAIDGAGTNNQLIERTTGRMNRDEIAQMRQFYDGQPGRDLYADLGVFGHGTFGDLSGDDRLRAERLLLGQPRNDKERAEVAMFAMQQQEQETGDFGKSLAGDSLSAKELEYQKTRLAQLSGGTVSFKDGVPTWTGKTNFNDKGTYTGADAVEFQSSTLAAQLAAENYAAKIDQYASAATTSIGVLGAIAAAGATVATGGAASPLLLAAISGVTGATSMITQSFISGGRYGWEQALTDVGLNTVQALTAGVGQGLGLASRGGSQAFREGMQAGLKIRTAQQLAAKLAAEPQKQAMKGIPSQMGRYLTRNAFTDKVLIGAVTGSVGSLGQTAFSADTYKQGTGKAIESLLVGTFRGALSGGVTATFSNAIEAIPIGRLTNGANLGDMVSGSSSMIGRGLGKSFSSSIGAFAGRGAELGLESVRGTYKGDAGDIFQSSLEAAGKSALQSFAEGTVEAPIHHRVAPHIRDLTAAQIKADAKTTATVAAEPQTTPTAETVPVQAIAPLEEVAAQTTPRPAGEAATAETQTKPLPTGEATEATTPPKRVQPSVPELTISAPQKVSTTEPADHKPAATSEAKSTEKQAAKPGHSELETSLGRSLTPEEQRSADILETMLSEVGEKRRMAAQGGLVDQVFQNLPGDLQPFLRRGERMPDRSEIPPGVAARLREIARQRFGQMLQEALVDISKHNPLTLATVDRLTPEQLDYVQRTGKLPTEVEFHHLLPVADFPEFAHLAEVGIALPKDVHRQAGHADDPTRPVEAGTLLAPEAETRPAFHEDPEARKYNRPSHADIAEGSATTGDIDRDILIEQRHQLRQLEKQARRSPNPQLTDQINQIRSDINKLEGLISRGRETTSTIAGLGSGELSPTTPSTVKTGTRFVEPGSPEYYRLIHEGWTEQMLRGGLTPSQSPEVTLAEPLKAGTFRDKIPSPIEAYAAFNEALDRSQEREVGIFRNIDTGEYAIRVGDEMSVRSPLTGNWETVMHYHPNPNNILNYRMPAPNDIQNTAISALRSGRTVTEFVEYPMPGIGRGRVAYTVVPEKPLQITIEYMRPNGERVKRSFSSLEEYASAWGERTTYVDPDSKEYRWILQDLDDYYRYRDFSQPPSGDPSIAGTLKGTPDINASTAPTTIVDEPAAVRDTENKASFRSLSSPEPASSSQPQHLTVDEEVNFSNKQPSTPSTVQAKGTEDFHPAAESDPLPQRQQVEAEVLVAQRQLDAGEGELKAPKQQQKVLDDAEARSGEIKKPITEDMIAQQHAKIAKLEEELNSKLEAVRNLENQSHNLNETKLYPLLELHEETQEQFNKSKNKKSASDPYLIKRLEAQAENIRRLEQRIKELDAQADIARQKVEPKTKDLEIRIKQETQRLAQMQRRLEGSFENQMANALRNYPREYKHVYHPFEEAIRSLKLELGEEAVLRSYSKSVQELCEQKKSYALEQSPQSSFNEREYVIGLLKHIQRGNLSNAYDLLRYTIRDDIVRHIRQEVTGSAQQRKALDRFISLMPDPGARGHLFGALRYSHHEQYPEQGIRGVSSAKTRSAEISGAAKPLEEGGVGKRRSADGVVKLTQPQKIDSSKDLIPVGIFAAEDKAGVSADYKQALDYHRMLNGSQPKSKIQTPVPLEPDSGKKRVTEFTVGGSTSRGASNFQVGGKDCEGIIFFHQNRETATNLVKFLERCQPPLDKRIHVAYFNNKGEIAFLR